MTISTVSTQSPEINIQHNQGSQQISGKLGEKSISATATSVEASNLARTHDPISNTPKKDLKVLRNFSIS